MFSIPLEIRGEDDQGRPFEAGGRTITLNRQGARVQVSHPMKAGQTIRVVNQNNEKEGEFRVVGPVSPRLDRLGEWAIEYLGEDPGFWDIHFPPTEEAVDAHVLLECRQCHTLALQSLSLVEVEVLETAGLLSLACGPCQASTTWGYPQKILEAGGKPSQFTAAGATGTSPPPAERRRAIRKPSQLPARVRDYYGETEIIQTENVSLEGFCFASARKYVVGQGVLVICPFSNQDQRPEVRARIVREEQSGESERRLYGLRFDQPLS